MNSTPADKILKQAEIGRLNTRIAELEVKLAAIADPKLVEKMDAWWHMENKELPALSAIIVELEAELATVKESLTTAEATIDKLREAVECIAESHDAGRHDGLPEPCPAHDAEDAKQAADMVKQMDPQAHMIEIGPHKESNAERLKGDGCA